MRCLRINALIDYVIVLDYNNKFHSMASCLYFTYLSFEFVWLLWRHCAPILSYFFSFWYFSACLYEIIENVLFDVDVDKAISISALGQYQFWVSHIVVRIRQSHFQNINL